MFWKKKHFWGSLIAVALLAYCLKDVRFEDFRELGHRLDPVYFIPSVICAFLFVGTKVMRWKLMIAQQKKISVGRVLTLYSAGQILNIVMPVLTGQVGGCFCFPDARGCARRSSFRPLCWRCFSIPSA